MLLMVATLLILSVAGMVHVVCRSCGVDEEWCVCGIYVGVCIMLLSFIAV